MLTATKKSVTIKDIASRLGISCQAVSMGINGTGRLSRVTREKILATARELNYVPNTAALSLVTQRSYLIGAVVPYINTSFFGNIIAGIEDVTYDRDFSLLLSNFYIGTDNERRALQRVLKRKIDGLIIYPSRELEDDYCAISATMPVVQIMEYLPAVSDYFVMVDSYRGARTAVRHLLELGHTAIGMITHDTGCVAMRQRHLGFLAELKANGLEIPKKYFEDCEMSIEDGEAAAVRLLRRAPEITALFAASDFAALGAIQAALKLNRRIARDLSIIGFDDLELAARQVLYPLTTIAQPKEEIGRLAGNMLLDLLQDRDVSSQLLDTSLMVRATTGPP